MNWEGLTVIGVGAIAIGVILYLPFRIWFGRSQEGGTRSPRVQLTRAGMVLVCFTLAALFYGLAARYIAPESMLGRVTSTSLGRLFYLGVLILVFWIVEVLLRRKGIRLTDRT